MAHELAHVKNRDTLIMTITATIAGAISMLANFALLLRRQPQQQSARHRRRDPRRDHRRRSRPMLVQMAISRTREYSADRGGAEISRQSAGARLGAGEDRGAAQRTADRRAPSAIPRRRTVHRQPAVRRAHGQPVLHPSRDREPHRGAQAHGRRRLRGRRRPASVSGPPAAAGAPGARRPGVEDRRRRRRAG